MYEEYMEMLGDSGTILHIFVVANKLEPKNEEDIVEVVSTMLNIVSEDSPRLFGYALRTKEIADDSKFLKEINPTTDNITVGYHQLLDGLIKKMDEEESGDVSEYIGAILGYAFSFS